MPSLGISTAAFAQSSPTSALSDAGRQPETQAQLNDASLPGIVNEWPKFGSEAEADFEYDHGIFQGGPDGGALNIQANQQFLVEFDNHWSISNLWTLAPLSGLEPGRERVLGDHALFVEELFARWTNQKVNIRMGKFDQNFARAWYLAPGLYAQDFVGDYAIGETLGVDAQFDLGAPNWGLHQISVSLFQLDRSILSDSLINRRGPLHYADGGAGNTKGPESFVVTYDATNVPLGGIGAADWQLSVARLAHGIDGDKAELRYAGSADINLPLRGGTIEQTLRGRFDEFRLFGEVVHIDNAGGLSGNWASYETLSSELAHGPWVFDLSGTFRQTHEAGLGTTRDDLESGAIGFSLPSDTTVAVGAGRERVSGQTGVYVGISLSQVFTTCDRCLIRARHY